MKPKHLFFIFLLIAFTACRKTPALLPEEPGTAVDATFSVASILQSNMVIQRDKPFKIWGTAPTGATVQVNVGWMANPFRAVANSAGKWEISIPAAGVSLAPQTVSIFGPDQKSLILENILIGDVWLCSGQSNMVMPMGNIAPFQGVEDYSTELAAANYSQIRYCTINEATRATPQTDFNVQPEWKICQPATAVNLSAVAYYFARKLNTDLQVPIGIVVSAVNGSWCESWMNSAAFQSDASLNGHTSGHKSLLYNGMINPLNNLSVKGFLWYQGENDQKLSPASLYTKFNSALIKGWRKAFNQGDLPFYYVQLTPFDETNSGNTTLNWLAYFREAQADVRNTPNTGMAVTMDAGEVANHHPKYKRPVGERLAALALKNTYGMNVQAAGPRYQSFTQAGTKITVSFEAGTANGLTTKDGRPINQHFSVAGADKIFRQGITEISGDQVIITVPAGTPLPVVAVRYAFSNFPLTNLQNSAGLPVEPFRTDKWD